MIVSGPFPDNLVKVSSYFFIISVLPSLGSCFRSFSRSPTPLINSWNSLEYHKCFNRAIFFMNTSRPRHLSSMKIDSVFPTIFFGRKRRYKTPRPSVNQSIADMIEITVPFFMLKRSSFVCTFDRIDRERTDGGLLFDGVGDCHSDLKLVVCRWK